MRFLMNFLLSSCCWSSSIGGVGDAAVARRGARSPCCSPPGSLLTRRGRQAASVANVGISTLRQRLGSSAVIVVGIAGVVGVLVALLAMAEGYSETLKKTGSADTAIVMRGASASEVMSVLERESVVQIAQAPGIARNAKGEPIASDEIVVAANLPVQGGTADEEGSVQLRGVERAGVGGAAAGARSSTAASSRRACAS